ncbi:MAG: FGGY family carbohydrate kinase [Armatimonadota bacterium]|nr:FGGY family carbohydrate kinase [Armatimonadota bacterium]
MGVLIGLDIGTTKLCAAALDSSSGRMMAVEDAPNDSRVESAPGVAEQDAGSIAGKSLALLARLSSRPEIRQSEVVGIGVTGQMHGVVVVDSAANPVTPLVTWQDGRGTAEYSTSGRSYAEELAHRLGDEALKASGCGPATGYGAVTLLRMKEEGCLPAGATALTIHDLIVRVLCGAAVTDPTDAASWGIFDVRHGSRWLPEALDALSLPDGMLPGVVPTGSVAGGLLPDVAQRIDLPYGTPVAAALGDNQASFMGSVPSMSESVLLSLGTGGQMSAPIGRFARADGLDTRPLVAGQWLLVGASLCGGRAYEILEKFFAGVGSSLFDAGGTERLYDRMNRLAADADEECGVLTASTLFEGSRLDPGARGSIANVSGANFTVGNLTRAVIKGMVAELAAFLDCARRAGAVPKFCSGSGNAVRRNIVVRNEIQKQVGMTLRMPPHPEEAAVGAALAAGIATGVYADWTAAGKTLFGEGF